MIRLALRTPYLPLSGAALVKETSADPTKQVHSAGKQKEQQVNPIQLPVDLQQQTKKIKLTLCDRSNNEEVGSGSH